MKNFRISIRLFLILLLAFLLCVPTFASNFSVPINNLDSSQTATIGQSTKKDYSNLLLYPGGMPFGVKITSKGLLVVGFSSTKGDNASPAYVAGIRVGDVILKYNGKDIETVDNFLKNVSSSGKNPITLTVLRENSKLNISFSPYYSKDERRYKTGIWVKDSTSGIGTITFINPSVNSFGGLGHGICDANSGNLISLSKGIVMDVSINGVVKGKIGTAGELKGNFKTKKIGTLNSNSEQGVFGVISKNSIPLENNKKMKICPKEELKEGEAYILCTLGNEPPQKYSINISCINYANEGVKSFKIKITDKNLLEKTGGIVQGMSGSPIIQNDRIAGAVTHVLINDPTSGYGIFIENMLDTMPQILK